MICYLVFCMTFVRTRQVLTDVLTQLERCVDDSYYLCFGSPAWVPGLRIDPLRFLAGCKKRLNHRTPQPPRSHLITDNGLE